MTLLERPLVDLAGIEDALREMWRGDEESEDQPVVRAHAATLVVYTLDRLLTRVEESIGETTQRFPGRVILIAANHAMGAGLQAAVGAHCHLAPEGHVCGEEITIGAEGLDPRAVPGIVAGLRPADVPSFLWWDAPIASRAVLMTELAKHVRRVIVDTGRARSPRRALGALAAFHRARRPAPIVDLTWTRTRSWRELIAGCFDAPRASALLPALESLSVEYSGSPAEAEALLIAGWLASRLGWKVQRPTRPGRSGRTPATGRARASERDPASGAGVVAGRVADGEIAISLVDRSADPGGLHAVRLGAGQARFHLEWLTGASCARVVSELPDEPACERVLPLSVPGESALLCEEMATIGTDRTFREALRMADALGRVL